MTEAPILLVSAFAAVLAAVHLFAGRFHFRTIPRSAWLSGAGGVSVAYVFVHILPELSERHEMLEESLIGFVEHHIYLVALSGFAAFYGLEQLAQRSRAQRSRAQRSRGAGDDVADAETETSEGVFWIHVGSFAAYNALIGYLLVHRDERGAVALLFFTVAMGLHFVVNDHGLRDHHDEAYDRIGRWLLAAGVLVGTGFGLVTPVDEALVTVLFAFLAGGVILNVIKEELPEDRQSRFRSFAFGAAAYAGLLLWV